MTTNLITGKSGTPHVTSGDMGAIQAGLVGNDSYLLQNSDGTFPAITMQDANNALVPVLNLVLEGRYARVTETQTVTIESGVTGQNRNDLVCMKYTRDDKNIESMTLEVLKGTPAEGTAADPTIPDGSIHEGAGEAWIPLARIPISGITPGTPVMLVKQLPPMSRLWDSVPLNSKVNPKWNVQYSAAVIRSMIIVSFYAKRADSGWVSAGAADTSDIISMPDGFKSVNTIAVPCVTNSSDGLGSVYVQVSEGKISLRSIKKISLTWCSGIICFPIS